MVFIFKYQFDLFLVICKSTRITLFENQIILVFFSIFS